MIDAEGTGPDDEAHQRITQLDPALLAALLEVADALEWMRRHRKSGRVQINVERGTPREVQPRVPVTEDSKTVA